MANLGSNNTPISGESFDLPSGWSFEENVDGEVIITDSGGATIGRRDETNGEWVFDSIVGDTLEATGYITDPNGTTHEGELADNSDVAALQQSLTTVNDGSFTAFSFPDYSFNPTMKYVYPSGGDIKLKTQDDIFNQNYSGAERLPQPPNSSVWRLPKGNRYQDYSPSDHFTLNNGSTPSDVTYYTKKNTKFTEITFNLQSSQYDPYGGDYIWAVRINNEEGTTVAELTADGLQYGERSLQLNGTDLGMNISDNGYQHTIRFDWVNNEVIYIDKYGAQQGKVAFKNPANSIKSLKIEESANKFLHVKNVSSTVREGNSYIIQPSEIPHNLDSWDKFSWLTETPNGSDITVNRVEKVDILTDTIISPEVVPVSEGQFIDVYSDFVTSKKQGRYPNQKFNILKSDSDFNEPYVQCATRDTDNDGFDLRIESKETISKIKPEKMTFSVKIETVLDREATITLPCDESLVFRTDNTIEFSYEQFSSQNYIESIVYNFEIVFDYVNDKYTLTMLNNGDSMTVPLTGSGFIEFSPYANPPTSGETRLSFNNLKLHNINSEELQPVETDISSPYDLSSVATNNYPKFKFDLDASDEANDPAITQANVDYTRSGGI